MGRNISIAAGDHPLDALTTHPVAYQCRTKPRRPESSLRAAKHQATEIGHDVWIGDNVVILAGVKIGTGAVIGANAVVTKDVAPYSIAVGVPAKPIRKRFPDDIAERLLLSEWWTLKKETVQKLEINDIEACLAQIPLLRELDGTDETSFQTLG
jgi:acetyltransferase-like isoleucine patch superfamily enzyme